MCIYINTEYWPEHSFKKEVIRNEVRALTALASSNIFFTIYYRSNVLPRVKSSNPRVISLIPGVTSSDPRVTSSNPRARRLKARVRRLKARVEAIRPRVR